MNPWDVEAARSKGRPGMWDEGMGPEDQWRAILRPEGNKR